MESVVKVYLKHEGNTEIRRINVPNCAPLMKFEGLKEKIQTMFPILRMKSFKITWRDSDDDHITITNDEDVATAFLEMKTKVFTVTVQERNDGYERPFEYDGFIEGNVICDICDKTITGYRYKCMQCPNYDLCANCEHAGNHSQHMMMRASSSAMPRYIPKLMSFMARSARKAGIQASKEAHRAAKMCARAAAAAPNYPRYERPSGSSDRRGQCPMDEGFVCDMTAPLLDILHSYAPTAAEEAPFHHQPQPAMADTVENLIRGVMQTIFTPQAQAQTPATTGNTTPSSIPTEKHTATAAVNTPMELEQSKQGNNFVKPKESEIVNERDPDPPGWTFLQPQQTQSQQTEFQQTQSQPQRPTEQLSPADRAMEEKIDLGMRQLHDMGFSDQLNLLGLLRRYDGNVGHVVKILFETHQV